MALMSPRPLVLASASPRRQELLAQIGLACVVCPVDVDESLRPAEAPAHYVERLARLKAETGLARLARPTSGGADTDSVIDPDALLVLGADTTVVCDGVVLGKPGTDKAQGLAMLRRLSGRSHQVMTAVALAGQYGCHARLAITEVHFRRLAESEIEAYWNTGEPADKAGGYGIQGKGAIFVSALYGSYSAVVGLPLEETAELLSEAGQPVWRVWE